MTTARPIVRPFARTLRLDPQSAVQSAAQPRPSGAPLIVTPLIVTPLDVPPTRSVSAAFAAFSRGGAAADVALRHALLSLPERGCTDHWASELRTLDFGWEMRRATPVWEDRAEQGWVRLGLSGSGGAQLLICGSLSLLSTPETLRWTTCDEVAPIWNASSVRQAWHLPRLGSLGLQR